MTRSNINNKRLFRFLKKRVEEIRIRENYGKTKQEMSNAFVLWFLETRFVDYKTPFLSDGSYDGKIDAYSSIEIGRHKKYIVMNAKYSSNPGAKMTKKHYEEIDKFAFPFKHKKKREEFLINNKVKEELRDDYRMLYDAYHDEYADLIFITTFRRDKKYSPSRNYHGVKIFDIEDIYQTLSDDIDGAAPATDPLTLYEIKNILKSGTKNSVANINVVFGRVCDFVPYLKADHYDLLFARNVRVAISTSKSNINESIANTYGDFPKEFAVSNNGITIVCDAIKKKKGGALSLSNPRVVNGGQTLNSIRNAQKHPKAARVMVRIIEVGGKRTGTDWTEKKLLSNKIARRANEQNPIKKWDLVANDDYQLELFRMFRARSIFYDRRVGEYRKKTRRMKSFSMRRGPSIKSLTQLLASFKYNDDFLGPANAKLSVSTLFDRENYDEIEGTNPEVVYQLALLYMICVASYRRYAASSKRGQMAKHGNLFCFTIACRAIRSAGWRFGSNKLKRALEVFKDNNAWEDCEGLWQNAIEATLNFANAKFKKEKSRGNLTANNYFKTDSYLRPIFEGQRRLPAKMIEAFSNALAA